jgi:hypothetical protein
MADLYIYYRVRDEHAANMAPRVRAMQAQLGVAAQLKRRPESTDGMQTWMEIYPDAPAGFESTLALAVAEHGLAELTEGSRHIEVFTELRPCA